MGASRADRDRLRSWRRRLKIVHRLAQDLATQGHYFRELRTLIQTSTKIQEL